MIFFEEKIFVLGLGVPLTTFGSVPSRLASLGASHPPTAAIPGTSRKNFSLNTSQWLILLTQKPSI
jgi:hypothetical protein